MKKWAVILGLVVLALLLSACGGRAKSFDPICAPDLCVTDIRLLRVDDSTLSLVFETSNPDGSTDTAAPPTFNQGLRVGLVPLVGEGRYLDRQYASTDFSCIGGEAIPGAEGRTATACLLVINNGELTDPPESGESLMLTIYSDTFPLVLQEITMP